MQNFTDEAVRIINVNAGRWAEGFGLNEIEMVGIMHVAYQKSPFRSSLLKGEWSKYCAKVRRIARTYKSDYKKLMRKDKYGIYLKGERN